MEQKHPLPPFTLETAKQKIQMAEDAWNSQNPDKVSLAYTVDSEWRNRNTSLKGGTKLCFFWRKNGKMRSVKVHPTHAE